MKQDVAEDVTRMLDELEFHVEVSGYKSSEGDGRTAADIEREREERRSDDGSE